VTTRQPFIGFARQLSDKGQKKARTKPGFEMAPPMPRNKKPPAAAFYEPGNEAR